MIKLPGFLFFLLWNICCEAQSAGGNFTDISLFKDSTLISDKCRFYIDDIKVTSTSSMNINQWKAIDPRITTIPDKWISKTIYLNFTLINNSSSTEKIFFFPGVYYKSASLYHVQHDTNLLPLKHESRNDGFYPIKIERKEKLEIVAVLHPTKRKGNSILPQIIKENYLKKYQKNQYYAIEAMPVIGFLLSGILLMMIFFTAANYFLTRKKEFLYNFFYSICMFLLIFLNTYFDKKSGPFSSFFLEYLDFILLIAGTVFYIAFTRKFLDTRSSYPLLHKIFVYAENGLVILLACYSYIHFFTNNFPLQDLLENGMKIFTLALGIVYIVIALIQRNKLMNYLAIGNAVLILFSIISFVMIVLSLKRNNIFTTSMFYYEVGLVSEIMFFLLGLTYKNRIELIGKIQEQESLKRESEKQSYESKLAILKAQQNERNRISTDMHDDLGAGVTAIRLYSELAKKRMGENNIPEIDKISSSANELLNNMNAIIWTMSSSNDSLDSMAAYIRGYALEYFDGTGICCHIDIDEELPALIVSGELRRNIYLVVKEALNNILKHSRATEVFMSLKKAPQSLLFCIQDNGTGIDFDNIRRFGNGLKNMQKRMDKSGIKLTIENNNGTRITMQGFIVK